MIRCIAIDDEPLALAQVSRYIGMIPDLELVGACLTISQAQELMLKEMPDLLFLDIEMPGCNGVDFAKRVTKEESGLSIIFTTAYPQYAVDGFRVDAVDYLLKPLSFEEMQIAVEKVKRRLSYNNTASEGEQDYVFVKNGSTMHKIHLDEIVYIKGLSEYVQICIKGETKLLTTLESLKHFENTLSHEKFLRIHKSYIINLNYIETVSPLSVIINGIHLPIGKKYRQNFKQYLKTV
ncbi:MAG: response regulator transcription factor [Bacteroidales bacterium]|nr:response regulator transcription factor [Bacteroidales bacterium]